MPSQANQPLPDATQLQCYRIQRVLRAARLMGLALQKVLLGEDRRS